MKMRSMYISRIVLLMIAMQSPVSLLAADNSDIGLCYGMQGNDLPSPADVVALYKKYGIGKMRIFDPNPSVLEALKGSNIEVSLNIWDEDIQNLASSQAAATSWFVKNMEPYISDVKFIFVVVGNEVIPGEFATSVAAAMQNLLSVLRIYNLTDIRVTTAVSQQVLQNTYPPSASEFQPEVIGSLVDILKVLSGQGEASLMANLYPCFAYATEPEHINLSYAQFTATDPVVRDGNLDYYNSFNAILDGFYWAMEKAGFPDIGVAVSESGWPSAGNENFTTPELASTYNKNFVQHILSKAGSPKRPNTHLEAFLFAVFDENLKPSGMEQHMGLFYPDQKPVYPVFSDS